MLQQKASVSFEDAVLIAQSVEMSKKEASQMQTAEYEVKALRKPTTFRSTNFGRKCFRCGKISHTIRNCTAKNLMCKKCGKEGHIQVVCLSAQNAPYEQKQVENAAVDTDGYSSEDEYPELNQ